MFLSCLSSTVKNTSGAKLNFPFLGKHGVELENNGEYTQWGDIREQVSQRYGGFGRQEISLQQALTDEALTIVHTPAPILYDETLDQSIQLMIDNDVLSGDAACWVPTTGA